MKITVTLLFLISVFQGLLILRLEEQISDTENLVYAIDLRTPPYPAPQGDKWIFYANQWMLEDMNPADLVIKDNVFFVNKAIPL